ncbi:MAG: HAD hydrolase family protein [Ignisphaera sp.]|nr:HAD hydrolase family protein [Ignisphaera sp.]MCX8167551.1 HAD hydrolase family protein [Ignisphaera sp.]MDW8086208.1 HAD hydrolase family protein [Ignisphaera sp.]
MTQIKADVFDKLNKRLSGAKPQMIFIDIDGVLTLTRGSYTLDLETIEMLRRVEELEVPVCLTSGNSYPTVLTLQRYLGLSPIFIAENGCVIQIKRSLIKVCRESLDNLVDKISKMFNLQPSDSNMYRLCDRAFKIPQELKTNILRIRELERSITELFPNIYAMYTGYVLHIYSRECGKGKAMEILARELNVDLSKSIAIGDSITDIDMLKTAGLAVVVGDADSEVREVADIVLPYTASTSTKFFLRTLMEYIKTKNKD